MNDKVVPQVSVVIVNYNYCEYLSEAIDSVLAQGSIVEAIVVDDGSSDGSRELIQTYGERIVTIFQENAGACAARNAGLSIASAPFVKFLDADDWLVEGGISRQLEQAASLPSCKAAVFGDVIWVRADGRPLSVSGPVTDGMKVLDLPAIVSAGPLTSAPLHRREDLLAVGGFDTRVHRGQEHDLHVRLSISGVLFYYRTGVVYSYRQHSKPWRISASGASAGVSILAALQRQVATTKANGLMTTRAARAFAHRFWRQGRDILRSGSSQIAFLFFAEARSIFPEDPVYGSSSYRWLNQFCGPRVAEWVGLIHNSVRSSFFYRQ